MNTVVQKCLAYIHSLSAVVHFEIIAKIIRRLHYHVKARRKLSCEVLLVFNEEQLGK